jgi:5-methylcytosine-specific restriction protein A
MEYSDQLKDERWLRKRLKILIRDKHSCQLCGYIGSKVNVHHKKYTGMAWEAPDEDLITLCKDCHKKLHLDKIPAGKTLTESITSWLKDLLILDS